MSTDSSTSFAELQQASREGDPTRVLEIIRAMPPELRERVDVRGHESYMLNILGRHEEELQVLRELIAREPGNPELYLSVANALKTTGQGKEAVDAVRTALAIKPEYGRSWWVLSDLKSYRFTDSDLAAMRGSLASSTVPADRQHLHFALGTAFEQRGDAASAFAHYAEGNALGALNYGPRATSVADRVNRSIATCTANFFAERKDFGHESDAPIFIVGLYRSGSTLIEQILASHPDIEATGELSVMNQIVRSIARDEALPGEFPQTKIAALDASRTRDLGAEYLARAQEYRSTDKPRFVDKMPINWLHVGVIRLILPNATIIDARRHPMATGFSNFRQNYGAGNGWSYSLESIGRYYADYLRLMRHFDRVLPGKIHHVVNERLIEDFEPEVRRLLDHVGVPFDPACLDFHRSGRPVRSASAEQVRRPVNREGVDQWRAFEQWLGPLKDALGPDLENWQE